MTPYYRRTSPIIKRMAEDLKLRNRSPHTIDSYTYHADKFCQHFGKPPEELGPEEIRQTGNGIANVYASVIVHVGGIDLEQAVDAGGHGVSISHPAVGDLLAETNDTINTALDTTLTGNTGSNGGGLFHRAGALLMENVTVSGNSVSGSGGGGVAGSAN